MKLNGKDIAISSYTTETVCGKTVLYNEAVKKIVVVNQTADFIWRNIIDMYQQEKDLSTEEIAGLICRNYHLGNEEFQAVCKDTDQTIASFFDASLLI